MSTITPDKKLMMLENLGLISESKKKNLGFFGSPRVLVSIMETFYIGIRKVKKFWIIFDQIS